MKQNLKKSAAKKPGKPAAPVAPNASSKSNVRFLIICIAIATTVAVTVSLIANSRQNEAAKDRQLAVDKASFAKIETDMADAYAEIVTAVGKPDESKSFKSCSRVALKYEEGELWCNVGYSFKFNINNLTQSQEVAQSIETLIDSSSFKLREGSQSLIKHNSTMSNQKSLDVIFDGPETSSCNLHYEFKDIASPESLYQFSCSRALQQPIYPLAE